MQEAAPTSTTPAETSRTSARTRFVFVSGLVVICGLAARSRWPGLNPESLWYDDAWVALVKRVHWHEVFAAGRSSPIGFTIVNKVLLDHFPDLELAGQTLPFLAALAVIPVFGWLVLDIFGSPALALLGSALLAVSPGIALYSTRVKQYTVESLGSVVLFALFWRWTCATNKNRALLHLTAAAIIVVPFAHSDLFVALTCLHLGVLFSWRQKLDLRRALVTAGIFDALFTLYYFGVLIGQRNDRLEDYWGDAFVPMGEAWPAWQSFLYERVWKNFFAGAFPQSRIVVAACAAAVVLGVVAMLREQRTRPFALALLACIAQAFLLAARKLYPLGGYRLDLYLHPVHLLFSIAGLAWLLERLPLTANEIACGVLAAGLLWFLPGMGMPVQSYHDGKLASRYLGQLEHDKRDGDLVLIYPKDFYVTALYSHWKIVVHGRHHKTGYDIASKEPGVRILPWAVNHGLDKYLRAELAAKPARLFYFAVQRDSHIDRQIEDEIRRTGYRVTRRQLEDDTKLMTYERKLKSVSTP